VSSVLLAGERGVFSHWVIEEIQRDLLRLQLRRSASSTGYCQWLDEGVFRSKRICLKRAEERQVCGRHFR